MTFERTGFTLVGWQNVDGDDVKSLAELTDDVDLYGVWDEDVTYVAQIRGGAGFPTLQAAVDAAKEGDVIEFLQDITMDDGESLWVTNTAAITIVATGYTFTGGQNAYAIVDFGNLTIVDGTFQSNNESSTAGKPTSNSLFLVGDCENTMKLGNDKYGTLTVTGGTLQGNCGNVIKISQGTGNFNGGTVTQLGGGSRCVKADGANAVLNLNGGTIAALSDKIAVCVDLGGAVNVNSGTISGEFVCDTKGGAITIKGGVIDGTITIKDPDSGYTKGTISVPNTVDGEINPVKFKQNMTPFNIFERGFATVGPDHEGFFTIGVATYTITVTDGTTTLASYQMNTEAAQTAMLAFTGTLPESKVFDVWKLTKATGFEAEAITVEGNTLTIAAGAIGNVSLEPTYKDDIVPVDPTQPISGKTVEEVNQNLDKYLKVPEGVTDAGAYRKMFEAKAGAGDTVVIDLKPDVEKDIKDEIANAATSGSMLAPEDGKVTITARPGLYYGIKAVGDVKTIGAAEGQNWTMAKDTTVTVERPVVKGDAAFFQAVCSPAAKK